MPDVTELLERLAEHPPHAPPPVDEVHDRARHRRQRHRRRIRLVTAMTFVVALVGVVAVVRSERSDVTAGPRTSSSVTPPTLAEPRGGLTVEPARGLYDGFLISIGLAPDPGGEVVATQCAAEVIEFTDQEPGDVAGIPTDWCGTAFYMRSPAGRPDLMMEISRLQRSPSGEVDCASAPGRCVIMVGSGFVGERFAPLIFAEDLPPIEAPMVIRHGVDFQDGALVRLEGERFPPSLQQVVLMQCIDRPDAPTADITTRCDLARTTTVPLDADGTFNTTVRVFRHIVTPDSMAEADPDDGLAWVACRPCMLVVSAAGLSAVPDALVPLDVAATDEPIHPTMRITTDGPYQPGQRVRIEGEGFQAKQDLGVSSCLTRSRDACTFAQEGFTTADREGRFVIEAYPLPGADELSPACLTRPNICSLQWAPSAEGMPAGITLPLDLSG